MSSLNTALLNKVANSLRKNPYGMRGSKWQNAETETIATQAIVACSNNLSENSDAFTWAGNELTHSGFLVNNAGGLSALISDGYIVMENYDGNSKPPANTLHKKNVPQVLRVTNSLLEYAEELIG